MLIQKSINKKQEKTIIIILLVTYVFYLFYIYRSSFLINNIRFFTMIDDAFISMRYAQHLANGFGLVWNIGEAPVEGFTNLGWTLYLAVLHKISVTESKMPLLVLVTGSIILLVNAYFTYRLSLKINPDFKIAPIISLLITAFYFPLVYWSLRGMEVGIITLLITASANFVLDSSKPLGMTRLLFASVLIFGSVLVRFDSILQMFLILMFLFYRDFRKFKDKRYFHFLILIIFIFSILFVLIFQYSYFSSWLPNTYYLKVEGVTLAERLNVGFQAFVEYASRDIFTPFFVVLAGIILFRDLRKKEIALLLALFMVQCFYSLYVGGDFAEALNGGWYVDAANRFITQGMPFLFVLFGIVIERFLTSIKLSTMKYHQMGFKNQIQAAIWVGLITLIIISGEPWFRWGIYYPAEVLAERNRTLLALHIRKNTDEKAVIAVHAAGQIPYYTNRATIDLLGKNDVVIARGNPARDYFMPGHNKWNYEYSISQLLPDIIADDWGLVGVFLRNEPGYSRLVNGIWIRIDSNMIDVQGLENYNGGK